MGTICMSADFKFSLLGTGYYPHAPGRHGPSSFGGYSWKAFCGGAGIQYSQPFSIVKRPLTCPFVLKTSGQCSGSWSQHCGRPKTDHKRKLVEVARYDFLRRRMRKPRSRPAPPYRSGLTKTKCRPSVDQVSV